LTLLELAPDSKSVLIGGWQDLRLLELSSGREWSLELMESGEFRVQDARFAPDGQILLAVGFNDKDIGELRWWHLGRGGPGSRFPLRPLLPKNVACGMAQVPLGPDSKHVTLVSADTHDKKLHLLVAEIESGKIVHDLGEHPNLPVMLLFSPDGKQLLSVAEEKLRRWNTVTGKEQAPIAGKDIAYALFAPDGNTLGIVNRRGICLYDATSGKERHRLPRASGELYTMRWSNHRGTVGGPFAFSPDSKTVAVADGRTIRQWDVASGQEIGPTPYLEQIHAVAVAQHARLVAACSAKLVQLWDTAANKVVLRAEAWPDAAKQQVALTAVALAPDGRRLAVGASDGTVTLFDMQTGKRLGPIRFHEAAIASLVFLADGNTVVSADRASGACYWDAASGGLLRKAALPPPAKRKKHQHELDRPDQWHELLNSEHFFFARQLVPTLSPDGRQLIVSQETSLGPGPAATKR
jgi:WD40 repeat protein